MKQIEDYRSELDKIIEKHNFNLSDEMVIEEALKIEKLIFTVQKAKI